MMGQIFVYFWQELGSDVSHGVFTQAILTAIMQCGLELSWVLLGCI